MIDRGVDPDTAERHVRTAVSRWRRLGLVHAPPFPAGDIGMRRSIAAGGLCLAIRSAPDALARLPSPVFRPLEAGGCTQPAVGEVVSRIRRIALPRPDHRICSTPAEPA